MTQRSLPPDIEALAVVTPTPIASVDPDHTLAEAGKVIVSAKIFRRTGIQLNLGNFKTSNIDEARDQWSHKFARSEQADLIRKTGKGAVD